MVPWITAFVDPQVMGIDGAWATAIVVLLDNSILAPSTTGIVGPWANDIANPWAESGTARLPVLSNWE